MISEQQVDRAEREFAAAASEALGLAKAAERRREEANFPRGGRTMKDLRDLDGIRQAYTDADYMAESRAWILSLIRADRQGDDGPKSIPADAICFFREGNQFAAVYGNFVNLQESPAGFGDTREEAVIGLLGKESGDAVRRAAAFLTEQLAKPNNGL